MSARQALQIQEYQTKLQLGEDEDHIFQSAIDVEVSAVKSTSFSSFEKHLRCLISAKKDDVQKKERGLKKAQVALDVKKERGLKKEEAAMDVKIEHRLKRKRVDEVEVIDLVKNEEEDYVIDQA